MARRRHIEAPTGLRAELAAELRKTHDYLGHLRLVANPDWPKESMVVRRPGPSTWSVQADALDAGEPLTVRGADVKKWAPDVDAQALYRIEPDGMLTPVPERGWISG